MEIQTVPKETITTDLQTQNIAREVILTSSPAASPTLASSSSRPGIFLTSRSSVRERASQHIQQTPLEIERVSGDDTLDRSRDSSSSILSLSGALLGAGVLGFPFCFKSCGLVLATLLLIVTLIASELSMNLLLIASHLSSKQSYEELAFHAFGAFGERLVSGCIIVMNGGALVACLNILSDVASLVAGTVVPPGAEPTRTATLAIMTLFSTGTVTTFGNNHTLLNNANQLGVVYLLFFCMIVSLMAVKPYPTDGHLKLWDAEGLLVSFPVVVYGFTAHQVVFTILDSLRSPTLKNMTHVVQKSMFLSSTIYLLVGVCGYVTFGSKTAGDILRNFGGSSWTKSPLRRVCEEVLKVGYGISVLATMPLVMSPLQTAVKSLISIESKTKDELTRPQEHAVAGTILVGAAAAALKLPNLEHVFGLAGSTASVLVAFMLPAAIFLKTMSRNQQNMTAVDARLDAGSRGLSSSFQQKKKIALALLVFGIIAGITSTHALMLAIREEAEVVHFAVELVNEEKKTVVTAAAQFQAQQVAHAVEAAAAAAQELGSVQSEASSRQVEGNTKFSALANDQLVIALSELEKAWMTLKRVTDILQEAASKMRGEFNYTGQTQSSTSTEGQLQNKKVTAVSQTLDTLYVSSLEALKRVEDCRNALLAAQQQEEAGVQTLNQNEQSAVTEAFEATTVATQQVNSTMEALKALQVEKTNELVQLIHQLVKEGSRRNDATATVAKDAGRKSTAGSGHESANLEPPPPPTAVDKAIEVIKAASEELNVTEAAMTLAKDVVKEINQQAMAHVELRVEQKSAVVTSRAIEIAKELISKGDQSTTQPSDSLTASFSAITAAEAAQSKGSNQSMT